MTRAILIAGWAHGRSSLNRLTQELCPDMVCHVCAPYDLHPHYAQSLSALVEKENAQMLIGWSLGGLIALETCLLHPSQLTALVLISSTSRFCEAAGYECGVPIALLRTMRLNLRRNPVETLTSFYRQVHSHEETCGFDGQTSMCEALAHAPEVLDHGLEYLMTTDLRSQLSLLNIPVLLVHGDADPVIPASASVYIATHTSHARLNVIPKRGHNLPMACVSDIARTIRNFLHFKR